MKPRLYACADWTDKTGLPVLSMLSLGQFASEDRYRKTLDVNDIGVTKVPQWPTDLKRCEVFAPDLERLSHYVGRREWTADKTRFIDADAARVQETRRAYQRLMPTIRAGGYTGDVYLWSGQLCDNSPKPERFAGVKSFFPMFSGWVLRAYPQTAWPDADVIRTATNNIEHARRNFDGPIIVAVMVERVDNPQLFQPHSVKLFEDVCRAVKSAGASVAIYGGNKGSEIWKAEILSAARHVFA